MTTARERLNGYDLLDLGDLGADHALDAALERHRRARAVPAGAVERDLDDARRLVDRDEGDVAAVGLDVGTDLLQDLADPVLDRKRRGGGRVIVAHGSPRNLSERRSRRAAAPR